MSQQKYVNSLKRTTYVSMCFNEICILNPKLNPLVVICRCFGSVGVLSLCETLPECGSGLREWEKGEMCDDGNLNAGDGCSDLCTIEANFICTNTSNIAPDACCATLALCGNGILGTSVFRI